MWKVWHTAVGYYFHPFINYHNTKCIRALTKTGPNPPWGSIYCGALIYCIPRTMVNYNNALNVRIGSCVCLGIITVLFRRPSCLRGRRTQ